MRHRVRVFDNREKERERVNFTSTRYFIGGIIDDIIDVTPT